MGKSQRDKGARGERELVNDLRERNFVTRRVPLSGATEYAKDDVELLLPLSVVRVEVKRRAEPISVQLDKALGAADAVDYDGERAIDTPRELLTQYLAQQPHIAKASGVSPTVVSEIQSILGWPAT